VPPTTYPDKLFDLVFAISVLTHIQGNEQVNWIMEIHLMMTTYNEAGKFKELISPLFRVLEFHDGKKDIAKTGGQDL
jgi:hypothetical protein